MLLAAEMLKPLTPSMGGDERGVTEHFPHLVIVQNKVRDSCNGGFAKTHRFKFNQQAEFMDMEPSQTRQLEEFYSCVLSKSRLQWKLEATAGPNNGAAARDGGLKPHLVYVADMEGEREDVLSKRHLPDLG